MRDLWLARSGRRKRLGRIGREVLVKGGAGEDRESEWLKEWELWRLVSLLLNNNEIKYKI